MAPETRSRSSSSKRAKISGNDEVEPERDPNKRQKRIQLEEHCVPSKSCTERPLSRFHPGDIVPGRLIDLGFFTQEGFQFANWFKDMNWVSVMAMKQKFYPELVRQFYANLTYDVNKTQIFSLVKGKEIMLNQKSLKKILRIPNLGTEMYDSDSKRLEEEAGVSIEEALKKILDNPDLSNVSKVNSCYLKLEMRLLHQMVVHIILPRKRSFNNVSSMDLLVMWHILEGKPLNLPFLLLSHMIASSEQKNAHLPYGMILTSIFNYFKVSLEGEKCRELKSSDIFNEVTLHRMGYVKNEGGWFLKKDKVIVQPSSENQSPNNASEHAMPVSSYSTHQPAPSHDPSSLSEENAKSSASPLPVVSPVGEGQSSEEVKQPSIIEGIFQLVKGMKEDMIDMTMDSKLDDLQRKIEHLRSLVIQLRCQQQEKTAGAIFLLLEFIMADIRSLRSKMNNFGNKIVILLSELDEFLRERQDLAKVDRESIEWMIAETLTFQGQNRDIICRFETISSEILDFWDCLSSRMGG